jgi:hypothetical protein
MNRLPRHCGSFANAAPHFLPFVLAFHPSPGQGRSVGSRNPSTRCENMEPQNLFSMTMITSDACQNPGILVKLHNGPLHVT